MSSAKPKDIMMIISAFTANGFLGAIVSGFFVFYWILRGKEDWKKSMEHAAKRLQETAKFHEKHTDNTNAGDDWQP